MNRIARLRQAEAWIAWVRLGGVLFAVLEIGLLTEYFPSGYELAGWLITLAFGIGAFLIFAAVRRVSDRHVLPLGIGALAFDTAVICAYAINGSYEYGSPTRYALIFAVVEGALLFGLVGGVAVSLALLPFLAFAEWWRADRFGPPHFLADRITLPFGILLLTGMIVGWLVKRLEASADLAESRAAEAEQLRDRLGHRVDVLEAANRCARALGSSLVLEEAFSAFIRELRGLVAFNRATILLEEGGRVRVMATAGVGENDVFPAGSTFSTEGSILPELRRIGRTMHREDFTRAEFIEEQRLLELGLRSRVVAPLHVGGDLIGALALVRVEPRSFRAEEIELVTLLARVVANAVQNMRAFEAERRTVEELRRLSALRADFVSLVSHELRSPMAAVIGSARTLQQRWRELTPEQREAFLALIDEETSRLAALIADVLDTSRIEAGTFSYSFGDVDVAQLIEELVAKTSLGQDEVRVRTDVGRSLPRIRGDSERLRQVLANLIDNAVKYSPAGGDVEVRAYAHNGVLRIDVADRGPGIAREHQGLIFEKFGRARGGGKPGTGLGLFIARSIAEAHGGTLDVQSTPGQGATFTLALPGESASG